MYEILDLIVADIQSLQEGHWDLFEVYCLQVIGTYIEVPQVLQ